MKVNTTDPADVSCDQYECVSTLCDLLIPRTSSFPMSSPVVKLAYVDVKISSKSDRTKFAMERERSAVSQRVVCRSVLSESHEDKRG